MPGGPRLTRREALVAVGSCVVLGGAACASPTPPVLRQAPGLGPARAELDRLDRGLAMLAAAYNAGERPAWERPEEVLPVPGDPGAAYDVMRALGVRDLVYAPAEAHDGQARVRVSHRVDGCDLLPAEHEARWSLAQWPARRTGETTWCAEAPGASAVRAPDPSGGAVAAVLATAPVSERDEALRLARVATRAVGSLWPAPPVCPVVVAPATAGEAARWGGTGDAQTPAVTVGVLRDGRAASAQRIVLNPDVWRGLAPAGRQVVLTHEAVHLAVRRDLPGPRATWLEEGLCEYVAYRGVELPETAIVAPLVRAVVAHGLPARLPTDQDFERDRPAAYGAALLACRVLAERSGPDAPARLLRESAGAEPVTGVAEALRRTGSDVDDLTHAWRERLARLAEA